MVMKNFQAFGKIKSLLALPTCGLTLAESERYLPILVSDIEGCLRKWVYLMSQSLFVLQAVQMVVVVHI